EKLVSFALKRIAEIYPELANVKIVHKYGGLIDFTPDWIPVISAIDKLPGLHVSAGFSGHGFGIGPAAGRLPPPPLAGGPPGSRPPRGAAPPRHRRGRSADRRSAPLSLQPPRRRNGFG